MKKGIRIAVLVAVGVLLAVIAFMLLDRCQRAPGNGAASPSPTPELTEEQLLARQLIEPGGQVVYSDEECDEVFEAGEPWCVVIRSATPITRPEWEELLAETEFYLVKTGSYANAYPPEPGGSQNWLIVQHQGERFTAETFDELLQSNGIAEITDANRALVAKTLVLMTLRDYLEYDIVLSDLEPRDVAGGFSFEHYNYGLSAWTRLQGLSLGYLFMFDEGRLRMVKGWIVDYATGEYLDVPYEVVSPPAQYDLNHSYWSG
jgi:hypothetical protein